MRRTSPRALLLAVMAAAFLPGVGCEPTPGPVKLGVLAWNSTTGSYELKVVEVTTLTDIPAMRGDAATLVGAATIKVDTTAFLSIPTEAQFRDTVVVDEGGEVEAQFLEQDGVLWPQDFHSLNLATSYYNFEQARLYSLARGMDAESVLQGLTVYYFPDFRLIEKAGEDGAPLQDNAAFFPLLHSFLLLPFMALQEVPLSMNLGVIAHEYGHGLFNAKAHGGAWLPASTVSWSAGSAGAALLGSLEEGYADAWGAAVSGDPRFAPHSLGEYLGDTRDLDRFDPWLHCYSQQQFDEDVARGRATGDPQSFWLQQQYFVGTVFAAALYRAGQEPGTTFDQVMDALLRSYADVGEQSLKAALDRDPSGNTFGELALPVRALLAGADAPTRSALCAVFFNRLQLVPSQLDSLCDGVAPVGECP